MKLNRKLLVVALASALPWMSVYAQSPADLQKEIELLKGQLKLLSDKIEAMSAQAEPAAITQQVTRLEQKMDLAEDDAVKSGLKGLKIKGVIEASYTRNSLNSVNTFAAGDGNGATGMLEFTKEAEGGDGVNWTLRLTPGGSSPLHEATVSLPLGDGARVFGGLIPDFQGYEYFFAHQNPFVTHNALFDNAGPTSYAGIGMSYPLTKEIALKWMIGNIDAGNDASPDTPKSAGLTYPSAGLAYRFDWTLSEYASLGLSGAHSTSQRKFNVVAVDGGYIRGDLSLNGHLNVGNLTAGAYNGGDAKWWGVSGLAGFKMTPRLQLLARADFINNRDNGGGTYVGNYLNNPLDVNISDPLGGTGLGPELDAGGLVVDQNMGANLTRISLGTNFAVNPSTQWKTELRMDRSSGYNFIDTDGTYKQNKTTIGTSVVVSF
jgi:hypothetical protein